MLANDLTLALDRMEFAKAVGLEEPDAWQRDLLSGDAHRILLNVTRQGGKSTLSGILGLHEALYSGPCLVLILAPALRQSAELIRTIKEMHGRLDGAPALRMESVTRLELENGSRLIALPGSEATVRGYSAPRMIILDEAARIGDDLVAATMPMIATVPKARIVGLSTPAGRRGWFFNQWTYGGERWHRVEATAEMCPRIDQEFLEEQRRQLGDLLFSVEYMCQFLDVEGSVFADEIVRAALSPEVQPLWAA